MSSANDPIALDAPIAEVTLLEDRGHVIRRGVARVPGPGLSTLRIEGVSPVISDKTLVAQVSAEAARAGARVIDARVRRRAVVRLPGEDGADSENASDRRSLELERDRLEADIEAHRARYAVLERHVAGLEEISAQTYVDLAGDASWGREVGAEWSARLDELRQAERDLRSRQVDLELEAALLEREFAHLQTRIRVLDNPSEEETAAIEIDLQADEAGELPLRVDYIVPGACWRPYHTARLLEEASAKVALSTDACVWQNTGEDWDDVKLVFSTERPSLGTEPPELSSDVLRWKRKSDAVVVETREQEVDTVGLGAAPAAVSPELPGIDDGGEAVCLRAEDSSSVPSDGKPYRISLASFESDAEVELVTMPELDPCVITRSRQSNEGSLPILAGPVDLIRQNGFVGRSSTLFVAPGERFELGWGPQADLRVKRHSESKQEKSRRLSSWLRREHEVRVRLSNLGARRRSVLVTERVPVSEIDKVKIDVDPEQVTGGKTPDEDGLLSWRVELAPFGHEIVELRYLLRKHEDVRGI